MGNRLFIGNFPFETTEAQLRSHFEAAGHPPASVKIVTDRETGRSRGFGFVEFASDEQAAAARALDGSDLGGRALKVDEAQEKGAGGKFGGGGGFRGAGGGHAVDRGQKGGFGSRGPAQNLPRGSTRGGGRGGSRGT